MAARRCSICAINYPLTVRKCPACGEDTWVNNGAEGEDVFPDEDTRTVEPPAQLFGKIEPPVMPVVSGTKIVTYNNQTWVADENLEHAGYSGVLMAGSIIKVAGQADFLWFELAGRARWKGVGDIGGWWLHRIPSPSEMFADLPVIEGTDWDGRPLPPEPDGDEA